MSDNNKSEPVTQSTKQPDKEHSKILEQSQIFVYICSKNRFSHLISLSLSPTHPPRPSALTRNPTPVRFENSGLLLLHPILDRLQCNSTYSPLPRDVESA